MIQCVPHHFTNVHFLSVYFFSVYISSTCWTVEGSIPSNFCNPQGYFLTHIAKQLSNAWSKCWNMVGGLLLNFFRNKEKFFLPILWCSSYLFHTFFMKTKWKTSQSKSRFLLTRWPQQVPAVPPSAPSALSGKVAKWQSGPPHLPPATFATQPKNSVYCVHFVN